MSMNGFVFGHWWRVWDCSINPSEVDIFQDWWQGCCPVHLLVITCNLFTITSQEFDCNLKLKLLSTWSLVCMFLILWCGWWTPLWSEVGHKLFTTTPLTDSHKLTTEIRRKGSTPTLRQLLLWSSRPWAWDKKNKMKISHSRWDEHMKCLFPFS